MGEHLTLVVVGRMYEHGRLFELLVGTLEEQNATPELGWDGEHHVTTGGARAMTDSLLAALAAAGYRIERTDDLDKFVAAPAPPPEGAPHAR